MDNEKKLAELINQELSSEKDPLGIFAWNGGDVDYRQCHLGLDLLNGLSLETGSIEYSKDKESNQVQ